VAGVLAIDQRQQQDDQQRDRQHAGDGGDGAGQAEIAPADHQRQVHHVGAGHDLRDRPFLDELLLRQPAFPLDQFLLHDRQNAAKALQRQQRERNEQVAQRPGLRMISCFHGVCRRSPGFQAIGSA
jgi:hypothetical protein